MILLKTVSTTQYLLAEFSLKRVIARTLSLMAIAFVALSVPHFGIILSLVGATTIAGTNFIFPPLFYILLSRKRSEDRSRLNTPENFIVDPSNVYMNQERQGLVASEQSRSSADSRWSNFEIPLYIKVLLVEIILIGLVGGAASVYSGILSLVDGSSGFTTACYVNWTIADV